MVVILQLESDCIFGRDRFLAIDEKAWVGLEITAMSPDGKHQIGAVSTIGFRLLHVASYCSVSDNHWTSFLCNCPQKNSVYYALCVSLLTENSVQYLRLLSEEENDSSSSNAARQTMEHPGNAHDGGIETF